jgi:hypothetical protein
MIPSISRQVGGVSPWSVGERANDQHRPLIAYPVK